MVSTAASAGTTTKPPPCSNMPATKPRKSPAASIDKTKKAVLLEEAEKAIRRSVLTARGPASLV